MENIAGVAVLEATSETNPDNDSVSILDDDALLGVSLSLSPSTHRGCQRHVHRHSHPFRAKTSKSISSSAELPRT